MKVELTKLAHARSGDKGDTANVGVIAHSLVIAVFQYFRFNI